MDQEMSDLENIMNTEPTRCGFVALIGAPNAGKSTLTNQLAGTKVSIVTHKVQTTRARIRAIAMEDMSQIILVDTPGIFAPKRRLDRAMVDAAWEGAKDADIVVLLIDAAKGLDDATKNIVKNMKDVKLPKILALNKIDTLKKEELLKLTQKIADLVEFDKVFMISALNGEGVHDLRMYLSNTVPFGPWLYPEDQIGDASLRYTAAEITREKLYLRLHEELPYASTVETTQWKQLRSGDVRVEQIIYVERDSQKKIVLGKNGQTIKIISTEARKEIAEMAETNIHLFIFVKVRSKWGDDPERYREMGLEFPKK